VKERKRKHTAGMPRTEVKTTNKKRLNEGENLGEIARERERGEGGNKFRSEGNV